MTTCTKCEADNHHRDYPLCVACEPFAHFTHRTDCRCDACAPVETLHRRYRLAPVGSPRAAELAIQINRRNALTPILWCEACFSDTCAHTQPEIVGVSAEQVAEIVIESLPVISGIRFLGAVPR